MATPSQKHPSVGLRTFHHARGDQPSRVSSPRLDSNATPIDDSRPIDPSHVSINASNGKRTRAATHQMHRRPLP